MSELPAIPTLNYNELKAKKNFASKVCAGKKIDAANAEIKAACVDTNSDLDKTKVGQPAVAKSAESQDRATYCVVEGQEAQSQSSSAATGAVSGSQVGESSAVSTQSVGDIYAANTERFAQMNADASTENEEIVAQLEKTFTNINDSGAQMAANASEIEALGAELDAISTEDDTSMPTSMAAGAGGQDSAYSLNIPTGGANNPSKAKGKNKGGLISPATSQPQQANTQPASSGENSDQAKIAKTQAIYARLAQIESSNVALMDSITTSSAEAMSLQQLYEEGLNTIAATTYEEVAVAEEEQSKAEKTAETFATISKVGQYTKLAGKTTEAVGTGITVAGMTVKTVGATVKGVGGLLNGIGGGLKALGVALLPGVFTAPAGTAVGAAGAATAIGGATTVTSGNVTFGVGTGLSKAGIVTQKVGKGVALAGEAGIAVGSAGTMVTAIASGNIMGAITGAMSFLGSATQFLGNAGQFAECIGKAEDGFGQSLGEMSEKVNGFLNKSILGNKAKEGGVNLTFGNLNQAISFGSGLAGAKNTGDVIGGLASGMSLSNSSTGESSNSINLKKSAETLGILTAGRTDSEIQTDIDKVKPDIDKAKGLGINTDGKTINQIRKEIAEKEAEKDGTGG